jgi:hypothetical protein
MCSAGDRSTRVAVAGLRTPGDGFVRTAASAFIDRVLSTRERHKGSPLIGPLSWAEPTLSETKESYESVHPGTQSL